MLPPEIYIKQPPAVIPWLMRDTGMRAYVTPTIVHFGAVLALAAFMCVPRQTLLSVSLGVGGIGIAGLVYIGFIASNIRYNLGAYLPVLEHWICNVILPCIAYASLIATMFLMWRRPDPRLNGQRDHQNEW